SGSHVRAVSGRPQHLRQPWRRGGHARRLSELDACLTMLARVLRLLTCMTLLSLPAAAPIMVSADTPAPIQLTRFASAASFSGGTFNATQLDGDHLVLAPGAP